ncbi:MAG: hypothetical protein ACP5OE_09945 [Thermodesulfobium sp.]
MRYETKKGIINLLQVMFFFAIWLSIVFAGQGSLYFDALGFFIAGVVVFADKIYRFLRRRLR